jgi:hypothetical protein
MESLHENCFVVFKRHQGRQAINPELAEEPLGSCGTYAEAKEILDQLHRDNLHGVIRYQGLAGGGD